MSKPRVFVTRLILESGLNLIRDFCEADIWPEELPPSRQAILEHVRGMDGLLCLLTDRIDAEIMDAAGPGLKVISNHAVGVDNVDVAAASARGIPVGNTPGILTDATADMAFALLLAAARRVVEGDRLVKAGGWKTWGPGFMLGADLAGATLGIVGFGRIGRAVARRAGGFGMRIIFTDPAQAAPEPGVDGNPGGSRHAPARGGFHQPAHAADRRNTRPDQRRYARTHETDCGAGQHLARPGGGPAGIV